jgi:hypothetical protein
MSKPMPLDDFRAVRIVLEDEDFALVEGPEGPPTDLVDREVWNEIVTLPDDVAVRTSNHYGQLLRILDQHWTVWVLAVDSAPGPIGEAMLDAADEFRAAIFNAMHGYYRQACGCLRNALEAITTATACQVTERADLIARRNAGELGFGAACDALQTAPALHTLRDSLIAHLSDSIFDQKTKTAPGGWARRLYSTLSGFEHSSPSCRNGDMWQSNGPVFAPKAFHEAASTFFETSSLCFLLVKMAQPLFSFPDTARLLHQEDLIGTNSVAVAAYEHLFGAGRAQP